MLGTARRKPRKFLKRRVGGGAGSLACCALPFLLSAGLLLGYLSCRTELTRLGYERDRMQRVLREAMDTTRRLELEIARLSSLGRIERLAREELGMTPPERVRYVALQAEDLVAVAHEGSSGGGARPSTRLSSRPGDWLGGAVLGLLGQFIGKWLFVLPGG